MTIVSFRARELIRYENDKEQSKRKKEKTEKEHSASRLADRSFYIAMFVY